MGSAGLKAASLHEFDNAPVDFRRQASLAPGCCCSHGDECLLLLLLPSPSPRAALLPFTQDVKPVHCTVLFANSAAGRTPRQAHSKVAKYGFLTTEPRRSWHLMCVICYAVYVGVQMTATQRKGAEECSSACAI